MRQSYVMNASLYSCWLPFTKQEKTLYPGKPNNGNFWYRKLWTFEIEEQILKMTLPQKNGHRIKTPSSKLTILVSSYWKKNFIRNNAHKMFHSVPRFLEIIDQKCCILSGPPCIMNDSYLIRNMI